MKSLKRISGFVLCCLLVLGIFANTSATAATPAQIEAAITNGINWLAAQQDVNGYWEDDSTSNRGGTTGLAVLKLEDRAYELGYSSPFDLAYPYSQNVEDGLAYLFGEANSISISNQPAGDPDTDGDGVGVYVASDDWHRTYETGIAMMAIAASKTPNRIVNSPGSPVNGWTYKQVLQDMADYLAFGQVDNDPNDPNNGRGGWDYTDISGPNQPAGWSDNSNSGYAVLGLAYAESSDYGFNCTIPAFVKSELNIWIDYIQNDVDGDPCDGGSGYSAPNDWVNVLKTGNLIFEMTFFGDSPAVQRVQDALDYLGRTWNDPTRDPGWKGDPCDPNRPNYQAMYCIMKGLEYAGIDIIDVNSSPTDWYAEFADAIVSSQDVNGSWPQDEWGGKELATDWALLTLEKTAPPEPEPPVKHLNLKWSQPPIEMSQPAGLVYASSPWSGFSGLSTVNPSTGLVSIIGPFGGTKGSITEIEWSPDGSTLYATTGGGASTIHTIDPTTGVALSSVLQIPAGTNLQGLEFDASGVLLGTQSSGGGMPSDLVTVNTITGVLTMIGPTGFGPIGGLAFDSGFNTLYGITSGLTVPPVLLSVNPSTGAALPIAVTTMSAEASSLEFTADGRLVTAGNDGNFYEINPTTGVATLIGPLVNEPKLSGLSLRPTAPTAPVYWGWDEISYNKDYEDPCGPWKIVADDFRCLGSMPVASIHWWGSHYGWEDANELPAAPNLPDAWLIGFWSNSLCSVAGGKTDVLFLTDTTGSMGGHIVNFKTAISGILTAINTGLPGADIEYGVADYRNYTDGGNYQTYGMNLIQSFTSNTVAVQAAINSMVASGGADTAESHLKGMVTISTNWLTDTNVPDIGFGGRAGAQKILIWAGDAHGHIAGDEPGASGPPPPGYYPTLNATINALTAQSILVFALNTVDCSGGINVPYGGLYGQTALKQQADEITSATGGTLFCSVGTGGPSIEDAIVGSITGAVGYSCPEQLLWQINVDANRVIVDQVGTDYFCTYYPNDVSYQYYLDLETNEYFWQKDFEPNTIDDIFWLSIAAVYPDACEPPVYPWGWKTRPWSWMDDAVTFNTYDPCAVPDPCFITPIEDPCLHESYDVAFELDTDPNYIKWEQPFTGIRDWPHYEDELSMAFGETGGEPGTKYVQEPDLEPNGMDVLAGPLSYDGVNAYEKFLADDFLCTSSGPITDIHIWASYNFDIRLTDFPWFSLVIYENVPADACVPYSRPGAVLWDAYLQPTAEWIYAIANESFYDPNPDQIIGSDSIVWRFDFDIDPNVAFVQEEGQIYWLGVHHSFDLNGDGLVNIMDLVMLVSVWPAGPFGWKTSSEHFEDDAVWTDVFTFNGDPHIVPSGEIWNELRYPIGHPFEGQSIDLAFEITTQTQESEPNIIRLVADDWFCELPTPVTALAFWGSYIGYEYKAGHEGPWMDLPVKPDYFRLNMWTDVPADDPCNIYTYSHPNDIIWEYDAYDYDEVLVGYDKHPLDPCALGREPVFRYSVRIPREEWFWQDDVNNNVYWLSVVAVYDQSMPNNYDWGWTNHKHEFNDDAVAGTWDDANSIWIWEELFDQTDTSEDMSFILFTDPYAGTCWDPAECIAQYAPDAATAQVTGLGGDSDCTGDVDFGDLAALMRSWGKTKGVDPESCDPVTGGGKYCCCTDWNHDGTINFGDLAILMATWGNIGASPSTGEQSCPICQP